MRKTHRNENMTHIQGKKGEPMENAPPTPKAKLIMDFVEKSFKSVIVNILR